VVNKGQFTEEDDALLEELGVELESRSDSVRTTREERIISGFEEIQRFVEQHGHTPQHGEDKDIFERLYAVRLDRLRTLEECQSLLSPLDQQGLLGEYKIASSRPAMSDDELLGELGVITGDDNDITQLRHVQSRAEIRAAEEIANREKCVDFDRFQPLFQQVERELESGIRQTRPFEKDASIDAGNFFVLGGQLVYVAGVGETIKAPNGANDARLRVIYSNGTESNLLRRSLQRALYKDEAGRRITEPPNTGSLFSETWEEADIESGTIYVLRSRSKHPFVAEHRELIHKIGVTGGRVDARIANAAHDATYLLAEVEVVATYKLAGINRVKLEAILHRIFTPAQINLTIQDRFGQPVQPREWFLAPLQVIDEAIRRILDGTITDVVYDPKTASLVG